jgi:AraC-like DNA-binding protein
MDPRIKVILRMVEESSAAITLDSASLSQRLGLSQEYLLRLFQREVGKTFREYLRIHRMAHAFKLVQQHDLAIKEIASECGYTDVSNFYRDFRAFHSMTPRQARLKAILIDNLISYGLRPHS